MMIVLYYERVVCVQGSWVAVVTLLKFKELLF